MDRIIKLDEAVREAFRNIKNTSEQDQSNSGVDDQLEQIQRNYFDKMKENAEKEAGMWLTLLGLQA